MKSSTTTEITKPKLAQQFPLPIRLENIAKFLEEHDPLMASDIRLAIELIMRNNNGGNT